MTNKSRCAVASFSALAAAALFAAGLSPVPNFIADSTFQGSSLTGWHVLGQAEWKAENGEITGSAGQSSGGWLVLDKSYQDSGFFARFRCGAICKTGILLRIEKTGNGWKGLYVSLATDDLAAYRVTLDSNGRELSRTKLPPFTGFARVVAQGASTPAAAPATAGRGRGGVVAPGGRTGLPPPIFIEPLMPPPSGILPGQWNSIEVVLDANILRPYLNDANGIATVTTDDDSAGYGPLALFVGAGEARFKDISFKDLNGRTMAPEKTSTRFRMQRLDEFYYAWGVAAADFNRDGIMDIVAGPYIYLGPDYTTRKEIYLAHTFNPSTQFASGWVTYAYDFTGDGWPDVLNSESRPLALYVNPKGENRRWDRYPVLPQIDSELSLMKDIDGDGKPEIIFGSNATLFYGKPDPEHPTQPWKVHQISEPGYAYGHGMGVGDINGDGRMDIVQAAGWWEQPSQGADHGLWIYHPEGFGRWGRSEGAGGGEMAVYDVNGDGLNDIVTSLNAHGWGLAWFEQKRDSAGKISFVRHMIMDNFSTPNAGGATFAEMHASIAADVDGDGIPDFITGKRYWSHLDSYTDVDPYGLPVLYWFRTVRNPKAPGGAEFVPELIHNRSGVGAQIAAVDLNGDGAVDIITSTDRGTFIFWGKPKPKGAQTAPAAKKSK